MKHYYVMNYSDNKHRRYGLNQSEIQNAIQNGWSNTPLEFDSSADAKLWIRNHGGQIEDRTQNGSAIVYVVAYSD